jgi:hypothetical protein
MLSRTTSIAIASATVMLAGATGAVAAPTADQKVRVISSCTKATYQPKSYIFFCADGGAGLKNATYDWWTAKTAHGTATYYYNDCTPSCVAGTVHERKAEFTVYRVRETKNQGPLFTRVDVATRHGHHVFEMTTRPF